MTGREIMRKGRSYIQDAHLKEVGDDGQVCSGSRVVRRCHPTTVNMQRTEDARTHEQAGAGAGPKEIGVSQRTQPTSDRVYVRVRERESVHARASGGGGRVGSHVSLVFDPAPAGRARRVVRA